jgi:outer membrane protein OmpA-like peptidoglycan-associated protein
MRSYLALAILACAAVFAGRAAADPAYTKEDIVKHFAPQLGPSRGICIGTEAECGEPTADTSALQSFDLVVTFDLNSDDLTSSAKQNLDEFAEALQDPRLAAATFEVDGHTDAYGEDLYNQGLSERRAEAVVQYLSAKGIDTSKLIPKGFGKTQPRNPDNPFDPANRRVETRLLVQ